MTKRIAGLFPGQGSQKVGMGRDWADAFEPARDTFAAADAALGFELSRLVWEGPAEELELTANTQPAILTCSVAMWRVVTAEGVEPVALAGHSLGEYSALVAAGALELEDAVRLVRRRGELMQEAVPAGKGAMAAVMGIKSSEVQKVAERASAEAPDGETCTVANFNSPLQTVIAGHRAAVELAVELAREAGARSARMLAVSAPFHSPLMRPAREALEPELAALPMRDPKVPVVINVDAEPVRDAAAARDALIRQVDAPVRWVESIHRIAEEGVDTFLEVGFGRVLTGLGRRTLEDAAWLSLPAASEAQAFLEELA